MEMNTRLQVEHPVTEMVWGLDLVELQLRIAAGEPLPFTQADLVRRGHAVEARVYAEDVPRGFLPTGGRVVALHEPTDMENVRVDSSLLVGSEVGSNYDPMLSKVIAWGPDRGTALRTLDRALASTSVLGVTTNIAFLRLVARRPRRSPTQRWTPRSSNASPSKRPRAPRHRTLRRSQPCARSRMRTRAGRPHHPGTISVAGASAAAHGSRGAPSPTTENN